MHVRHLSVVDFRSYAAADLELQPGVTTLIGLNGQGKTNLAEAIGYLSSLSSHRVATDAPLVRHGAGSAVLRAVVARDERELLAEVEIAAGRANRARLNRAPLTRARDLLGALRTVLFAPEDLALVKGDPGERRRFLDDLLVARQPRWAGTRADYDRVVRQRNALLKSAGPVLRSGRRAARTAPPARPGDEYASGGGATDRSAADRGATDGGATDGGAVSDVAASDAATDGPGSALRTLGVWDDQLATHGAALLHGRLRLLGDLRPLVDQAYRAVSAGEGGVGAAYQSSLRGPAARAVEAGELPSQDQLRADLRQTLAEVRGQEVERGVSLVGPHRDEVELRLGDLPARGYASHGESWSLALALRLAAFQLLRRDLGDDPVLVLDDVFAELDAGRRGRLAALVGDCEQVLVTAAVPEDVPRELIERGRTFRVRLGAVERVG